MLVPSRVAFLASFSLSNPFMINYNITGIYCTSFHQHGTTRKKKHFPNLRGRCYLSWGRVIRSVKQSVLSQWVSRPFLPSFIHSRITCLYSQVLNEHLSKTSSSSFSQKAPSFRVPWRSCESVDKRAQNRHHVGESSSSGRYLHLPAVEWMIPR